MLGEFKYYDVNVVVETLTEKGTVKKNREHHLVWGKYYQDVDSKFNEMISGSPEEWNIKSVKESDVTEIYGK